MKNKIQFQKGLSLMDFLKQYGSEQQCREAAFKLKWPDGFRCPRCGYDKCCEIKTRHSYQCSRCHHQTSLLVDTIFEQTKLPLTVWFMAIYLVSLAKTAISAMSLMRRLGVSYNSALYLKHKLMQVMLLDESKHSLHGTVQIDDAYWGGVASGGKRGRGSPNKTPFVAAVEVTEENHPLRAKLNVVEAFTKAELTRWGRANLVSGSGVVSDGLGCFSGLEAAGFWHCRIVTGGGRHSVEIEDFAWVNILISNLKTTIHGTYHSISAKHLPRYLAEFEYRFNHRFNLAVLPEQLIAASVRTLPVPLRLLKQAEAYW